MRARARNTKKYLMNLRSIWFFVEDKESKN